MTQETPGLYEFQDKHLAAILSNITAQDKAHPDSVSQADVTDVGANTAVWENQASKTTAITESIQKKRRNRPEVFAKSNDGA